MNQQRHEIPLNLTEDVCKRHHIKKLAFFGSYLRGNSGSESDIDFLVEFDPDHVPGLFGIAGMEIELSELPAGRKVDLRTRGDLSHYFRDKVVAEAEVKYVG
jgi:uncharacterized protein